MRRIEQLEDRWIPVVEGLLVESFWNYPVMRYVIGPSDRYEVMLHTLIGLFVANRTMRQHPVLGALHGDHLLGVALLTPSTPTAAPGLLVERAEKTWITLGPLARQRYQTYCTAAPVNPTSANEWHLNMLGVSLQARSCGVGSRLLQQACMMAASSGGSTLSLSTEVEENVGYYLSRGFRICDRSNLGELTTWSLVTEL